MVRFIISSHCIVATGRERGMSSCIDPSVDDLLLLEEYQRRGSETIWSHIKPIGVSDEVGRQRHVHLSSSPNERVDTSSVN